MSRYLLILACLSWALGTNAYAQGAGGGGGGAAGGAGGATGGGAGAGATGGAAVGGARSGAAVGAARGVPPGGIVPGTPVPGGVPGAAIPPASELRPGSAPGFPPGTPIPGNATLPPGAVGTTPATGLTPGQFGTTPGAIGGVGTTQPGIPGAAIGNGSQFGTAPGAVGGMGTGVQQGVGTGNALPPGTGLGQLGGFTGSATDIAFSQRIRAQLLNSQLGNTGTGLPSAAAMVTPQTMSGVQINANNGVVTLSGTVPNRLSQEALDNQVRRMTGVRAVIDRLAIAPPAQPTAGNPAANIPGTGAAIQPTQP